MFPKSWMLSTTHHETERHGPLFTSLAFATEITGLQKLRLEEKGVTLDLGEIMDPRLFIGWGTRGDN